MLFSGAGHSFPHAINAPDDGYLVQMTNFNKIDIDVENSQVIVGAGVRLGNRPEYSYNDTAAWEGSLNYELDKCGLALTNLGSISHQTVSGFISAGSTGPTTIHDLGEAIMRVRIIDGNGEPQEFTRPEDVDGKVDYDDEFFGICLSMGLCGIITEFTIKCVPTFNLIGTTQTCELVDLPDDANLDLFADETKGDVLSYQDYLIQHEYSKIYWWPQKQVARSGCEGSQRRAIRS
eukprot:TRINITY_DN114_c0_g1_i5.p1 TRINITY_DN114_c0_g1~~TRINITY_DN114_c0_g1_i5.p1  ORF type:complete len:234 (+),score=33.82 TRINITY_DN114_c0_g1_i5:102-803(+)